MEHAISLCASFVTAVSITTALAFICSQYTCAYCEDLGVYPRLLYK